MEDLSFGKGPGMKPYSLDLRQRGVEAYENGEGTHEELAEAFCVSCNYSAI